MVKDVNPGADAGREMKSRLRTDLREAMKGGRAIEAALIRALAAAIDNAEAPPLEGDRKASDQHRFHDGSAEIDRLHLDSDTVRRVLAAEVQERETAATEMARLGRPDRAEALRAEALLARRYLD